MGSLPFACLAVVLALLSPVALPAQFTLPGVLETPAPTPTRIPRKREAPLRIVTTTAILADITRHLAGDLAVVTSLMPAGTDLHTFEPSAESVKQLATADLVVVNGLGLEGWLDKVIANSGFLGPVVVAADGVEPIMSQGNVDVDHGHDHDTRDQGVLADDHEHHHDHDHQHGGVDPHAWTDVMAVAQYAKNIRDALIKSDPYNRAEFEARNDVYTAQLKVLHNFILRETSKLTPEQRILVMDHDAMAYFARRYGFTVRTLRGASTREEANAYHFGELGDFMRRYKVRTVYVESSANPRLIAALTRETGARVGDPLLVHSPAPPGEVGDDYIEMMMLNVMRIARGAR